MDTKYPEIEVTLSGIDGNAISIVMVVKRALQRAGVPTTECDAFQQEALSGDYDKVITTCMEWVTVD